MMTAPEIIRSKRDGGVLSADEIATIAAWAEKGAVEGDAKDKPAPVAFNDGWTIGKPDIIVQFPKEIQLPATGVIDHSFGINTAASAFIITPPPELDEDASSPQSTPLPAPA